MLKVHSWDIRRGLFWLVVVNASPSHGIGKQFVYNIPKRILVLQMWQFSLINSLSHSALGAVLGCVVSSARAVGVAGKLNIALPNKSLNAAFSWTAHCVGRPLARRYAKKG